MFERSASAVIGVLLAVSLCACAPKALEVTPGPSVMPAVEPVAAEDVRQAWADDQINAWLSYNGARSIEVLRSPANFVDSWDSPEAGVLVVHTKDGAYSEVSLGMVASSIFAGAKEAETITVINEFGKLEATITRLP